MTMPLLTDVIYARVSTDEQKESGRSVVDQESKGRRHSEETGGTVVKVFTDDGFSGGSRKRPALQEMLAFCKENTVSRVIVVDTDRIARNTNDHFGIKAVLKGFGTRIDSINQQMLDDSPEGNLLDGILASVNAFYPQVTGRKTADTMYEKALGGWFPGPARLGYVNYHDPLKDKGLRNTIVPHPLYGPLVSQAFDLFSTGQHTIYSLVDEMKLRGLTSITGRPVEKTSIRKMLGDIFYVGKFLYKGTTMQGKHEPLTTQETFDRCQAVLEQHNRSADRKRKHTFLLNGFLVCGICGNKMTASLQNVRQVTHYHCPQPEGKHSNEGQYVRTEDLDGQVSDLFQTLQLPQEVIDGTLVEAKRILQETHGETDEQRRQAQAHKAVLEARRDSLETKFADDEISHETYKRQLGKTEADLHRIAIDMVRLNGSRGSNIKEMEQLLLLSRDIRKAFAEAPHELKRTYLALFWEKIVVKDRRIVEAVPTLLFRSVGVEIAPLQEKAGETPTSSSVRNFNGWLPG